MESHPVCFVVMPQHFAKFFAQNFFERVLWLAHKMDLLRSIFTVLHRKRASRFAANESRANNNNTTCFLSLGFDRCLVVIGPHKVHIWRINTLYVWLYNWSTRRYQQFVVRYRHSIVQHHLLFRRVQSSHLRLEFKGDVCVWKVVCRTKCPVFGISLN